MILTERAEDLDQANRDDVKSRRCRERRRGRLPEGGS